MIPSQYLGVKFPQFLFSLVSKFTAPQTKLNGAFIVVRTTCLSETCNCMYLERSATQTFNKLHKP
jgi:hypothetical protein